MHAAREGERKQSACETYKNNKTFIFLRHENTPANRIIALEAIKTD